MQEGTTGTRRDDDDDEGEGDEAGAGGVYSVVIAVGVGVGGVSDSVERRRTQHTKPKIKN